MALAPKLIELYNQPEKDRTASNRLKAQVVDYPIAFSMLVFKELFSWSLGLKWLYLPLKLIPVTKWNIKLSTFIYYINPTHGAEFRPSEQNSSYGFSKGKNQFKINVFNALFVGINYVAKNIGKAIGALLAAPVSMLAFAAVSFYYSIKQKITKLRYKNQLRNADKVDLVKACVDKTLTPFCATDLPNHMSSREFKDSICSLHANNPVGTAKGTTAADAALEITASTAASIAASIVMQNRVIASFDKSSDKKLKSARLLYRRSKQQQSHKKIINEITVIMKSYQEQSELIKTRSESASPHSVSALEMSRINTQETAWGATGSPPFGDRLLSPCPDGDTFSDSDCVTKKTAQHTTARHNRSSLFAPFIKNKKSARQVASANTEIREVESRSPTPTRV